MLIESIFWVVLILIVHSYLLYPASLLFLSKARRRYELESSDREPMRRISILISAYNEEDTICERMSEFLAIDYPAYDIIVGIDGATDRTYERLREFNDERLRIIPFGVNRGKVWVLNDLCRYADGDVLVFSDANTRLDAQSLRKLERHFDDKNVGGVCGRLELHVNDGAKGSDMESEYWGVESWIKKLEGDQGMTLGGNGAIYAIRRELYVAFDSRLRIADDFILPMRLIERGYYFVYEPEALAFENSNSFKAEFFRKVKVGEAIPGTLKSSLNLTNPLRGFVAYSFWSHKIVRWFVPFLLLIAVFSNLILLTHGELYVDMAVMQFTFYFLAAIGVAGLYTGIQIPVAAHLGYFLIANVGLAVGLVRSLIKQRDARWNVSRE
ncbi:MAG TPA: glycosyltransferase [Candidatus Acidoferrales bacterium]|nr:glycosyltransferase [Candidatus Acidoferrales bacterium]